MRKFYSICSAHQETDPDCPTCKVGQWEDTRKVWLSNMVFKIWPWLWCKWANRKNSPDRKFLEETFPNLKKTDEQAP